LLQNTAVVGEGGNILYGQLLWTKSRRRPKKTSNKYITSKRQFSAIQNDTIQCMSRLSSVMD